jgi:hypothetical protein
LYGELLPYIKNYSHIFLMDEDISLVGFDVKAFLATWKCGFSPYPSPLIVQPLLSNSHKHVPSIDFEHYQSSAALRNTIGSTSGFIEQQVPLFEANFFDWFVRRVLAHTRNASLTNGVDFPDTVWCGAARAYQKKVIGLNSSQLLPCAAVMSGGALRDLNFGTIVTKKLNKTFHNLRAQVMVNKYKHLFPTWTDRKSQKTADVKISSDKVVPLEC